MDCRKRDLRRLGEPWRRVTPRLIKGVPVSDLPGRAFRNAFARRSVEAMADRRSFERGLLYAANGRVGKRTLTASTVKAKVRGSSSYQVKLSLDDDDEPAYDCSCPVGQEGRFCKHAVAVALVVTDAVADPGQRAEAVIDVRGYLEGLDHPTLVDLLVERAADDDIFDARLRMDAARATGGPPQLGVFRHAVDEAFVVGGYVGYREMYDYATNIDAVLDSLQDLLDDGHAEAVVALAEHAIDRAEDAVGYVDDSDGWMSGIAERLQDLHRAACAAAQPDPVALARTLFDRERHSGDLEVFYGAASAYAEVLGAEGLAEYRRLAQVEWDALPPLGPKEEERSWSSQRFRITQIMQTLAELTGDVDAVVEVLARDQSSAYQFVRMADVLREAKRYDDALMWAEKGLALHGGSDSRLVEVAAEEHHRSGRGEDAVRVIWDAYAEAPGLRPHLPPLGPSCGARRPVARLARQGPRSAEDPGQSGQAQTNARPRHTLAGAGARQLDAGRGAAVRRRRREGVGRGERRRVPARPVAGAGPTQGRRAPVGGNSDLAG